MEINTYFVLMSIMFCFVLFVIGYEIGLNAGITRFYRAFKTLDLKEKSLKGDEDGE